RAHQPEAGHAGRAEREVEVLGPDERRAARAGPHLERRGAAHQPAEVLHVRTVRRLPAGDLHLVDQAERAEAGGGLDPAADPVAVADGGPDPGGEHPLALPVPVHRRGPGALHRRGDVHLQPQLARPGGGVPDRAEREAHVPSGGRVVRKSRTGRSGRASVTSVPSGTGRGRSAWPAPSWSTSRTAGNGWVSSSGSPPAGTRSTCSTDRSRAISRSRLST